jgi:hypothetical protein
LPGRSGFSTLSTVSRRIERLGLRAGMADLAQKRIAGPFRSIDLP